MYPGGALAIGRRVFNHTNCQEGEGKMTTASQRNAAIKKATEAVAKAVAEQMPDAVADPNEGKLDKLNSKGEMLMCRLTVAQRPGAPDPLCVTINEEFRWIKRGKPVEVPWYVVRFMLDNIERKFRQEKDEQGKRITISEDMPSEPISYVMIDPAEGVSIE